jgi:hypothetical protein
VLCSAVLRCSVLRCAVLRNLCGVGAAWLPAGPVTSTASNTNHSWHTRLLSDANCKSLPIWPLSLLPACRRMPRPPSRRRGAGLRSATPRQSGRSGRPPGHGAWRSSCRCVASAEAPGMSTYNCGWHTSFQPALASKRLSFLQAANHWPPRPSPSIASTAGCPAAAGPRAAAAGVSSWRGPRAAGVWELRCHTSSLVCNCNLSRMHLSNEQASKAYAFTVQRITSAQAHMPTAHPFCPRCVCRPSALPCAT